MSSTFLNSADIRVTNDLTAPKRFRAVLANVRFLRRTAEMRLLPEATKEDLAAEVWTAYWRMVSLGMIEAQRATRSALRSRYGIWTQAGVTRPAASRPVAA